MKTRRAGLYTEEPLLHMRTGQLKACSIAGSVHKTDVTKMTTELSTVLQLIRK